jgi:hypothetical protein
MKRVWIVDDDIPVHVRYDGRPVPTRLDAAFVRDLIENVPEADWVEPAVLNLCRALCGPDFEAVFFLSPESMLASLDQTASPPHAVIFDWQYLGSTNAERNCSVLERLLATSFAYVQVYTQLGEDAVELKLLKLRERFGGRLLPTRMKADVAPAKLAEVIRQAWSGTIAGELADNVRKVVFVAVERMLIELCAVKQGTLAAFGDPTDLMDLVVSKVRDEMSGDGMASLTEILRVQKNTAASEDLRKLMSVWYYWFPEDDKVRRGDLIELNDGDLGLVVTPPCDLARFSKKTGSRVTWLRAVRLDSPGLERLRLAGIKFDGVGGSIVAAHSSGYGDKVAVLPNVPKDRDRSVLEDYAVLMHAWESGLHLEREGKTELEPATYSRFQGIRRRCSLSEPFTSAVIAKVSGVMSSPGTPDLPEAERARLKQTLSPTQAASGAKPAAKG